LRLVKVNGKTGDFHSFLRVFCYFAPKVPVFSLFFGVLEEREGMQRGEFH
jgi:hypothetical protein